MIGDFHQQKVGSKDDFETMLLIGHKLLLHASCWRLISSTDSNDCFTKQDAVKQAEVLGVNIKTMDYWLTKFVNSGDLQRIMNWKYQKANVLIAW